MLQVCKLQAASSIVHAMERATRADYTYLCNMQYGHMYARSADLSQEI